MTPLAQKIANELTLPKKDRRFIDDAGMLDVITDVHCFETTAVHSVAVALGSDFLKHPDHIGRLAFLPAPMTWIEFAEPDGGRAAILLKEATKNGGEPFAASVSYAAWVPELNKFGSYFAGILSLKGDIAERGRAHMHWHIDPGEPDHKEATKLITYANLALINTPRVIGRRQHMPHAGLQRKIAHARGLVGKFPLHAWTEIKLEVTPPRLDRSATGEPHETRLTGAKALHFCRCHLRIRLGQLELVTAHWRGDPALGMKQSRYRLVMPPGTGEIHA
jgi:hypothetical protein